jgi:UDP-3-O-[3-hydroxymyristoyl] N-acetylglucosamine deacetylase
MLTNYQSRKPAWQHTLSGEMTCVGRGLHSGQRVCLRLRPAPPDSGIRFVRTDVSSERRLVPAHWHYLVESELCTMLANEHGVTVGTVEHLLAALHGCEIDNAVIELDGPEVPIMDGSAAPFVSLLQQLGTVRQSVPRRALFITRPVVASESDRYAVVLPGVQARMTIEIDFPSTAIGRQRYAQALTPETFARDIAPARTFGFAHELQALRDRGLAIGGSLRSAILIDGTRVVNDEGLRFPDEFVRHKLLDCVGDLALLGMPVVGHLVAHKPGHRLCHQLLRALESATDATNLITLDGDIPPPAVRLAESLNDESAGLARRATAAGPVTGDSP